MLKNQRNDNILKDFTIVGKHFKNQQIIENKFLRSVPNVFKLSKKTFVEEDKDSNYILLQCIKHLIYTQKNSLNIYTKNYESYKKSKDLNYFDTYVNEDNKGDMNTIAKEFIIPNREFKDKKPFYVKNLQQFLSLDKKFFKNGSENNL